MFQQMPHAHCLGIKSLYLWWIPKIKIITCPPVVIQLFSLVFYRLNVPFPPLWGGRCNGQWGLSDALLAKGHLPVLIRLLLQMGVISEILDPLQCRNDNQEVTLQITPAKEGTRGPLEYSHQATSTSFGLVSSVVIWQSGIWARPCTSFAVLYDPSHSKMSQLISIWMKNSITYKFGR